MRVNVPITISQRIEKKAKTAIDQNFVNMILIIIVLLYGAFCTDMISKENVDIANSQLMEEKQIVEEGKQITSLQLGLATSQKEWHKFIKNYTPRLPIPSMR